MPRGRLRICDLYCRGATRCWNLYARLSIYPRPMGELPMLDAIFVAGGFAMFFVAIMYVFACDRL